MTVFLVAPAPARGVEPSSERRVKAAFLCTFAKYVECPAANSTSSTNAIIIGILGKDPFGKVLDDVVAGKTIDRHPISVQRFQRADEIKDCHIVFISASEKKHLADIQTQLRGKKILTVGDMDGFLQHGGQIRLVSDDSGVKFDINLEATRQAGLKLDANLLRVARRVIESPAKTEAD